MNHNLFVNTKDIVINDFQIKQKFVNKENNKPNYMIILVVIIALILGFVAFSKIQNGINENDKSNESKNKLE